jgi:hypothetical protein
MVLPCGLGVVLAHPERSSRESYSVVGIFAPWLLGWLADTEACRENVWLPGEAVVSKYRKYDEKSRIST